MVCEEEVNYGPQSVLAALGRQETVQLVTQRARQALNDQRETARRAVLHQQDQCDAAARQHLVNTLARHNEMQVQRKKYALEDQREFLVTEVAASYRWLCGPFFGSPWAWAVPPQI